METMINFSFLANTGNLTYVIMFALLTMSGIGILISEDLILIFAGYLSSTGKLSLPIVIIVSILGVLSADTLGYHLGKEGKEIIKKIHLWTKIKALKPKNLLKHVRKIKKEPNLIFFGRFMPTLKGIFPIAAGMGGFKWKKFMKINTIAVIISAPSMVLLGFYLKAIPPIILALTGISMFLIYFATRKIIKTARN